MADSILVAPSRQAYCARRRHSLAVNVAISILSIRTSALSDRKLVQASDKNTADGASKSGLILALNPFPMHSLSLSLGTNGMLMSATIIEPSLHTSLAASSDNAWKSRYLWLHECGVCEGPCQTPGFNPIPCLVTDVQFYPIYHRGGHSDAVEVTSIPQADTPYHPNANLGIS